MQTPEPNAPLLTLAYSVKYPQSLAAVSEQDIARRIVMTKDQCVLDNERFFLRGRIAIPVRTGTGVLDEPLIWGVWAEVSPKNFLRTNELWTTEGRENEARFRGYLDNELPLYGATINLEVDVETRVVGLRPHFHVIDPNHVLAIEQRDGITLARLEEINRAMHSHAS